MVQKLLTRLLEETSVTRRALTQDEILAHFDRARGEGLDLSLHRCFSEVGYARARVHLDEEFELAVICWNRGQESDVHDHGHSLCAYLVVEGEMTEELFASSDGESAREVGVRSFGAGEATIAEGHHLHRIKNATDSALVTVHLYSPPMADTTKSYRVRSENGAEDPATR